ncbi:phospholipid carrier-dependent glycosyltransferase [soil metagenome]
MSDLHHSDSPPAVPDTAVSRRPAGSRPWLWTVVLPLIVVLAAGAVRFHQLGVPERCYFDETYYYYDAREYLEVGTERSFAVHPPVGKWLIATGITLFGVQEGSPVDAAVTEEPDGCVVREGDEENPPARAREAEEAFARRVMSALFGTGAVVVTYFIGLRLFRRRSAALLGAALLGIDGLALTMSRISMLDIFLQFFVVLGVLALLVDRDRMWAGTPEAPPLEEDGRPVGAPPARSRTWLWLAGLFLGLAVATKWSGLVPLGLAWAWVLGSELWWRRRWTGGWTADLPQAIARGFLALVLLPVVVYLVSYAGWFANFEVTRKADRCAVSDQTTDLAEAPALPESATGDGCEGIGAVRQIAGGWWEEQGEIYRFHRDLEAEHPYRAPAYTWALMTRPVAYYYESCSADRDPGEECAVGEGNVAEVLGIGNPAIWWMALIGYPWLIYLAVRRRSWAAITIAVFLFGQALPYLASPRPVFLFYMTPVVPFIALALAHLADEALDSVSLRWVPTVIAILSLAGFVFWAPLFMGFEIPREMWDTLILFPGWV